MRNVQAEFLVSWRFSLSICHLHDLNIPLIGYRFPIREVAKAQTRYSLVEVPCPAIKLVEEIEDDCAEMEKARTSAHFGAISKCSGIASMGTTCPFMKRVSLYPYSSCPVLYILSAARILTCWWLRLSSWRKASSCWILLETGKACSNDRLDSSSFAWISFFKSILYLGKKCFVRYVLLGLRLPAGKLTIVDGEGGGRSNGKEGRGL